MSPTADRTETRARATAGSRTRKKHRPTSPAAEIDTAEPAAAPRSGAKRTLMDTISQLPNYLRLLFGLMNDRRVPAMDKLLVAGAIAYILLPLDIVPDFIPFLGQVDDVFLLVTSLQRLITNAGRRVVTDHWAGNPAELADMNLHRVVGAAAFFLPGRMRRRLKMIGRGWMSPR